MAVLLGRGRRGRRRRDLLGGSHRLGGRHGLRGRRRRPRSCVGDPLERRRQRHPLGCTGWEHHGPPVEVTGAHGLFELLGTAGPDLTIGHPYLPGRAVGRRLRGRGRRWRRRPRREEPGRHRRHLRDRRGCRRAAGGCAAERRRERLGRREDRGEGDPRRRPARKHEDPRVEMARAEGLFELRSRARAHLPVGHLHLPRLPGVGAHRRGRWRGGEPPAWGCAAAGAAAADAADGATGRTDCATGGGGAETACRGAPEAMASEHVDQTRPLRVLPAAQTRVASLTWPARKASPSCSSVPARTSPVGSFADQRLA